MHQLCCGLKAVQMYVDFSLKYVPDSNEFGVNNRMKTDEMAVWASLAVRLLFSALARKEC